MSEKLFGLLNNRGRFNADAIEFCRLFTTKNRYPKFIYGINEYAISVAEICEIDGFIDDFRQEKEFMGVPVLRLEDVPDDSLILIAIVGIIPVSIKKRVQDAGLMNIDYFGFCMYSGLDINKIFLFDFDEFREDFIKNRERYERVYDILGDDESRDVYQRIVNFRFYYDLSYMEGFSDKRNEQYFEEFLHLSDNEIFVDVGGFEGETTVEFIKRCPSYRRVYFFEPDKENFLRAEQRLRNYRDIHFFNLGLYNCTKTIRFQKGKDAGRISVTGEDEISVDRMDNVLKGPVSFIKMDIEGTECEALEGGREIIAKFRPKLAIAAYHKHNDFWKIPEVVFSISKKYTVFMRHYTEGFTETVMYFV